MISAQSAARGTLAVSTHGREVALPDEMSREILGMRVDATSYRETADTIASLAVDGTGGVVCVATVHMVMEAYDDPGFRQIVNNADRVTPDGVPLVWALRWLGIREVQRVYGPSLLPAVCALAAQRGLSVGFYGGAPAVLDEMIHRLGQKIPDLDVSFRCAPPFRPMTSVEDAQLVSDLRASGTQVLFVGLGCPKQERWMEQHRSSLPCVMVGVGAAFDFLAGAKPQAADWIQRAGLEWLFRLASEPRRLWHRYLYHNPRFLFFLTRELISHRIGSWKS